MRVGEDHWILCKGNFGSSEALMNDLQSIGFFLLEDVASLIGSNNWAQGKFQGASYVQKALVRVFPFQLENG